MPIRAETRARYPKDWKSRIVPMIRERSGGQCECTGQCGLVHCYDDNHPKRCQWHHGQVKDTGAMIVLTVMHLDHNPENNDPKNLLHGCQGCHLRYDAPRRHREMKERRRASKAVGDLFQCR